MKDKSLDMKLNRRSLLLAAAGAAPALMLTVGEAEAKVPPGAVAYQTSPHGADKCSNCRVFIAPHSCQLVSGNISPDGWCRLWVKK